jgi:hypothetical protein
MRRTIYPDLIRTTKNLRGPIQTHHLKVSHHHTGLRHHTKKERRARKVKRKWGQEAEIREESILSDTSDQTGNSVKVREGCYVLSIL